MQRLPGIEVRVGDKCIGCGTCTEDLCFVDAIKLIGNKAVISKECRGCGRCIDACPQQAIELFIDDDQFIDKTITKIENAVDVS